MKYRTEKDLVYAVIQAYYFERNIEKVMDCVTDDIAWIGLKEEDLAFGKEDVKKLLLRDVTQFPSSFLIEAEEPLIHKQSETVSRVYIAAKQPAVKGVSTGFVIRGSASCIKQEDGSWLLDQMQAAVPNPETEKFRLERELSHAESVSKAKGLFLSNMSHEIRTPLNAMIGYLGIAKDNEDDHEKMIQCIDNSEIAANHLLQIINDILDISAIESGRMKIASQEFDLKKEIQKITTIFYQNSKNKGVIFDAFIDNLTEEWVIGDPLRLSQILMNLLSNAVKFTAEHGHVAFTVKQYNEDEDKVYLKFIVSDNGIGMSEDYLEHLFTPFEQESAKTAQQYGGTGLGLSITHNLISMMGGKIDVFSEKNRGTTFTVTMCFDKSMEHAPIKITKADYSQIRVLLVDDLEQETSNVKKMLKGCGIKADVMNDPTKVMNRLKGRMSGDHRYHMCIIDWKMPGLDGIKLTSEIRKEFGSDLPVIVATAYDTVELEEAAKNAGVNRILSKPFFQSSLFDLIVTTFGKYKPQSKEEKKEIDMHGVSVLLAEDNEMNMDIATSVLAKTGIAVTQAVNGEQAYQRFMEADADAFDLIFMDVQMPVLNGYEATEKIRKSTHPKAKTIPIIAMTANAFAEDVTEALSHGMDAHIAKPINYDKLFHLVEKYR